MKAICLIIMFGVIGTVLLGPIGLLAGVFIGALMGFRSASNHSISAPKGSTMQERLDDYNRNNDN